MSSNHSPSPAVSKGSKAQTREVAVNSPKWLNWDEMKRKRNLRLCFSCEVKYTPSHRCKKSQLLLMEGDDEETKEFVDNHKTIERGISVHLKPEDKLPLDEEGNDGVSQSVASVRRKSNQIGILNRRF